MDSDIAVWVTRLLWVLPLVLLVAFYDTQRMAEDERKKLEQARAQAATQATAARW